MLNTGETQPTNKTSVTLLYGLNLSMLYFKISLEITMTIVLNKLVHGTSVSNLKKKIPRTIYCQQFEKHDLWKLWAVKFFKNL